MNQLASSLTDTALLEHLSRLAQKTDEIESHLIELLAEFLERDLHLTLGLRTVYAYATTVLGFSRDVAQKRIRAAKAVLKRPEALEQLRSGGLTVSSLVALAPAIETPGLLDWALGRSKREIEQRVAVLRRRWAPRGGRPNRTARNTSQVSYELSAQLLQKLATASRLLRDADGNLEDPDVGQTLERALDVLIASLSDESAHPGSETSQPSDGGEGVEHTDELALLNPLAKSGQQLLPRVAAWARRRAFPARRAGSHEQPAAGADSDQLGGARDDSVRSRKDARRDRSHRPSSSASGAGSP